MAKIFEKEGLLRKDFGQAIYQNFDLADKNPKMVRVIEFMIYFVGFLGALLALSQAYQIWFAGRSIGSLYSWIALAAFTPFWILYGITNKKFSLTMTYIVWLASALLVIIGIYVRG
jgi:hypothetical protein